MKPLRKEIISLLAPPKSPQSKVIASKSRRKPSEESKVERSTQHDGKLELVGIFGRHHGALTDRSRGTHLPNVRIATSSSHFNATSSILYPARAAKVASSHHAYSMYPIVGRRVLICPRIVDDL
jgi:hypothetical protein